MTQNDQLNRPHRLCGYSYGCFFLEEDPRNLLKGTETTIRDTLRTLGYINGEICYQIVEGQARLMKDGMRFATFDLLTGQINRTNQGDEW